MDGCKSFLLEDADLTACHSMSFLFTINNTAGWHGYDEVVRDVGGVTT